MFLCDNCHDPNKHMPMIFRSRGACEGCGKKANCIDCHSVDCKPPEKKAPKVVKRRVR
jgi:hypothetical protein